MTMKGFTLKLKPLEILTEEQVEVVHLGTLEVLEKTGLRIEHEIALKLLKKNGCEVDFEKKRVRFPRGLVEGCLRKAPSSFRVKARDSKNDLEIKKNISYFVTYPGMQIMDLDTWEPRTATRKENYEGVTVLDALDNLHLMNCYTPYFGFEGIPSCMAIPESVAARMRNSTKFQITGYQLGSEVFCIKMAKAVGSEIMGSLMPSPPLTYYKDAVENLFRILEAGFPQSVCGGGVMGGSTPATIAGATITNNAELMAGIVLMQLIKPGARVQVWDSVHPQDMRSGSLAFGAIGTSLHHVIFNQIWRKYGIPTACVGSGPSSSKKIDLQCGYEKAINALTAALSGANVICLHGGLYGELAWHPVQAILDDDIAGMIGRFIEGIEVTDETLAIDLIEEVGPIPGFYLDKEHTRKWWKKEQFVPRVADRLTYPEWMKTGKKSALDYAKERMKEIIATHEVTPLSEDQEDAIENILEEARDYYKKQNVEFSA